MRVLVSDRVPVDARPGPLLRLMAVLGLLFLIGFALLYGLARLGGLIG